MITKHEYKLVNPQAFDDDEDVNAFINMLGEKGYRLHTVVREFLVMERKYEEYAEGEM
jgi:hypothetical protein